MQKSPRKIKIMRFVLLLVVLCFIALFSWQIMNVTHALRRGIPLELYDFFKSKKVIDNLQLIRALKDEGKDANYAYLFEYNEEAEIIIDESEKNGKWKDFPIDYEVMHPDFYCYGGVICITNGWADFIDDIPISKSSSDYSWTCVQDMKSDVDGTVILIINDKCEKHLIFIKCVW